MVPNTYTTHFRPEAFDKSFNFCTLDYDGLMIAFDFLQELYERNHGLEPLFVG